MPDQPVRIGHPKGCISERSAQVGVMVHDGHGQPADRLAWWLFDGGEPLVGRQADQDRIGAFVEGVPRVGGSLLLLGEPGVGKTALLAAAGVQAEASGIRVLAVAGVEFKARLSYGGLLQLLNAALAGGQPSMALEGPLAAVMGARDGAARELKAVADAVLALIRRLARAVPVLLVLDDVHWLDPASAAVLGQVARRLDGTGVGMICTARPEQQGPFDYSGLPVHEVAPLSDPASEELLVQRFPALAPQVRQRLMAVAQGNPLALLELPAALSTPQRVASETLPERLPLSRRLQSAFASRVTGLPAATRYLLLLAALDGTNDIRVLWRATAGRCGLKHLAPAERAQLIRVDEPPVLRFRHSLTRAAVVELSTCDQRRSAHQALGRAWADVPERRAWHLAQAANAPDEQVAAVLERAAATVSRRGDGPGAVAALLRAADLSPVGHDRARRLAEAAYLGANIAGRLRDVPRLLDDARRADPGAGSLAAAMAGSVYLLNSSGDVDTAHRLLCGAVAQQPEPYDPADVTLLEALHTLLLVCFFGGRADLWPEFDAALAKYSAAPGLLAITRSTLADPARAGAGDLAGLDAAIAGLAGTSDPVHIVRVAIAGAYVDRLGDCAEALHRVAAAGRKDESIAPAIDALFLLGNHAWHTGQWPQLRQLASEGLELCEHHDYPMLASQGRFLLARAAAVCGEHDTAHTLADQMDQWAGPRRADAVRAHAFHIRALIAASQGDFEEAYQQLILIAPAGTLPSCVPPALWVSMDLVDAAVRTGRHAEALEHVAAVQTAGLGVASPRLRMLLHASRALAGADDWRSAFDRALSVQGADRWPFDVARIRLHYGERLRRARMPARARRQLSGAVQIFTRLGATPWAERARKELRACGGPAHTATQPYDAALTPQQREVANLAAAGLTNKQIGERLFLSPRTVSSHLHQLFPKLGVTSRAALRDALESLNRQGADHRSHNYVT